MAQIKAIYVVFTHGVKLNFLMATNDCMLSKSNLPKVERDQRCLLLVWVFLKISLFNLGPRLVHTSK